MVLQRFISFVYPLDLSGRLTNLDGVLEVISEGRELWYWSVRMFTLGLALSTHFDLNGDRFQYRLFVEVIA